MAYGERLLGARPLDFVDIQTRAGGVRGVAFILPWTPSLERRGQHRVYVATCCRQTQKSSSRRAGPFLFGLS